MGTISKALIFGASLLFALALITIAVVAFGPATESSKSATSDFSTVTNELKDQKYLIYDNTTISGSQVVNAIRKFKAEGVKEDLAIQVTTGVNGGVWYYNSFTEVSGIEKGGGILPEKINISTDVEYINPSGEFTAEVKRDTNSVIRAVIFKQKSM